MINNNRRYQYTTSSGLDNIIDMLGVTDEDTGMPPMSDEDRATIKIQLLYAQILARDIEEISKQNPKLEKEMILESLCQNFVENIKCLTGEILNDDCFQLNIMDLLKDFNRKY